MYTVQYKVYMNVLQCYVEIVKAVVTKTSKHSCGFVQANQKKKKGVGESFSYAKYLPLRYIYTCVPTLK